MKSTTYSLRCVLILQGYGRRSNCHINTLFKIQLICGSNVHKSHTSPETPLRLMTFLRFHNISNRIISNINKFYCTTFVRAFQSGQPKYKNNVCRYLETICSVIYSVRTLQYMNIGKICYQHLNYQSSSVSLCRWQYSTEGIFFNVSNNTG